MFINAIFVTFKYLYMYCETLLGWAFYSAWLITHYWINCPQRSPSFNTTFRIFSTPTCLQCPSCSWPGSWCMAWERWSRQGSSWSIMVLGNGQGWFRLWYLDSEGVLHFLAHTSPHLTRRSSTHRQPSLKHPSATGLGPCCQALV